MLENIRLRFALLATKKKVAVKGEALNRKDECINLRFVMLFMDSNPLGLVNVVLFVWFKVLLPSQLDVFK